MIEVIGVRFKKAGKVYYFDPDGITVNKGESVIVETARGVEYGNVVVGPKAVPESEIIPPLKKVLRVATEEDETHNRENRGKEAEAMEICQKKIEKHNLGMKLIDVEYTFDNNKVIFYFTAEGRVDFRELVKDLAAVFRTRIELRQIGVRDEAKMLNGIGPCGQGLCCANWLGEFTPVSIKMAKDQSLSLNPTKISGICGRLMCCLKYEHDGYRYLMRTMPKHGEKIQTPDGLALVLETQLIQERVKVKMVLKDGTPGQDLVLGEEIRYYKGKEISRLGKHREEPEEEIETEA